MAAALQRTPSELMATVKDMNELMELVIFDELEPLGMRRLELMLAKLVQIQYNSKIGKNQETLSMEDILPNPWKMKGLEPKPSDQSSPLDRLLAQIGVANPNLEPGQSVVIKEY